MSSLHEIKAIKSHNFYPEHYFAEAIKSDITEFKASDSGLKSSKQFIEKALIELSETTIGSSDGARIRQEIIDKTYQSFGYYDIDHGSKDLANRVIPITLKNRSYEVEVAKRIKLLGQSEIWLFDANLDKIIRTTEQHPDVDINDVLSLPTCVLFKEQVSLSPWKDVLSALFDCDHPHADWILLNTGKNLYLFEKAKWQEEESYLELDFQDLYELNHNETYKLALALFSPFAFPIFSAESFHEKIEQNAHKKASEVTKALRDTVRESIELLAMSVINQSKNHKIQSFAFDLEKDEDRNKAAHKLFDQCLKYVYRMLFMLFTESQDSSKGSLPVNSKSYQRGYAIEKLRDLVDVPMQGNASGHFIQETLNKSFEIYFRGYNNEFQVSDLNKGSLDFSFPSLGTSLFDPASTEIFNEVRITDGIMQQVLHKMSLAQIGTGKAKRTQRVHYANLGLNQLGAVYEGLLSLKPEILSEKVVLLEKEPKDLSHRYIPFKDLKKIDKKLILKDVDTGEPVFKEKHDFLLAPVGLERKFSASFYTPEVLTRFVAKEAVNTLLEEDSSLARLESIKILEPAMGSGAFLNAVVDELAPRIAKHKENAAAKERADYLNKNKNDYENAPAVQSFDYYKSEAKSYLLRNSVYGVDLNPTAVELAKVSLWLNCLHEDGNLPFMDFKLRLGNSLVGAWATRHYAVDKIPHWFYPNPESMSAHLSGKILSDRTRPFIEDEKLHQRLEDIRKEYSQAPSDLELKREFTQLAKTVSDLYEEHTNKRIEFQKKLRAESSPLKKQEIFDQYVQSNFAYNKLRFAMDLWCALWFWPHSSIDQYPNFKEFIAGLKWALSTDLSSDSQSLDKQIANTKLKYLSIARQVSLEQKFFHYDLEFAEVFSQGGFDLVLGNPPWAPVRWEEADFFEEVAPGIHNPKGSSNDYHKRYAKVLEGSPFITSDYKSARALTESFSIFLKNSNTYPYEDASNPNTYKYFHQRFVSTTKYKGIYSMIAQSGVISDDGCVSMRRPFYKELKKIYKFRNLLKLFEDIGHLVDYALWVGKRGKSSVNFISIDNLYHPMTVEKCHQESLLAPYRGMKTEEDKFELRGHPRRIIEVDDKTLQIFAKFNNETDHLTAQLPSIHGTYEFDVLSTLAQHPSKMQKFHFWTKIHEADGPKKGLISRKPGNTKNLERNVLTGPNIFVSNPANKGTNPTAKNKADFHDINLEEVADDFFPATVYKLTDKGFKSNEYNSLNDWDKKHNEQYRIFARQMVSLTGARTLSSALLPPGPSHVHSMCSLSFPNSDILLQTQGLFNSLVFDFLMRSISGGTIGKGVFEMTPALSPEQLKSPLIPALMVRALRLSSISIYYEDLWKECFRQEFKELEFKSDFAPTLSYSKLKNKWERNTCIRNSQQREQALCEIDAIVAILFGFSQETLLNLYRSQFGVLQANLQDLPNQEPQAETFHFPRFTAMAEAYDQAMAFVNAHKKNIKKSA